jgi:hypothetical protein
MWNVFILQQNTNQEIASPGRLHINGFVLFSYISTIHIGE